MDAWVVAVVALVSLVAGALLGWYFAGRLMAPLRAERDTRAAESEEWRLKFNEALVNLAGEAEKTRRLADVEAQLRVERDSASALRAEVAAFHRGEVERERAHQEQLSQIRELQLTIETRFGELAGQAVETAHDKFLK